VRGMGVFDKLVEDVIKIIFALMITVPFLLGLGTGWLIWG